MKKILFGWLTILLMPVTTIGGYHIIKLANVNQPVEIFLFVFGIAFTAFQFIMSCALIVQGYNAKKIRTPFDKTEVNEKLVRDEYNISEPVRRSW